MQAFTINTPRDISAALAAGQKDGAKYIAGGTDLMQLAKEDVETPRQLVDLAGLLTRTITVNTGADRPGTLRLGALATMSEVAANPDVRANWPAISEALLLSASPQIRNMGTMGGNLLQRTRCVYFRDTGSACNKRAAGSGCPAIRGDHRMLGLVGVSESCIATHPSDLPVALMAMDAALELLNPNGGKRIVPLGEFYRLPGATPQIENNLLPGEIIAAVLVPPSASAKRSRYIKVRDRASYEYALVSAAVALEVQDGTVREVRIALGGVGPKPWRLPQVEAALHGRPATDEAFRAAAELASEGAKPGTQNAFKVTLMKRTVFRGLQLAMA
jgi:xanthine dehydrogenase YagS FAD-binding subunit